MTNKFVFSVSTPYWRHIQVPPMSYEDALEFVINNSLQGVIVGVHPADQTRDEDVLHFQCAICDNRSFQVPESHILEAHGYVECEYCGAELEPMERCNR